MQLDEIEAGRDSDHSVFRNWHLLNGLLGTPLKVRELQSALHAKAKGDPVFRFYSLYDKLIRKDILLDAWRRCRINDGAAGIDKETFESIEKEGLEKWLDLLVKELREKTYQPRPVKRVWIPKPNGKLRPLGLPCIRDRVAQMATVILLEPIFKADLADEQYGYRPGRSAHDAVRQIHRSLNEGHREVIDADLSGYFDTIPHAELMKCLARRISDGAMLHLLKMWLEMPVEEIDERGRIHRSTDNRDTGRGTPQGAPISPLLSNLYMRRFVLGWKQRGLDRRFQSRLVVYADDFVILCRYQSQEAMIQMKKLMICLKLQVNEQKTSIRKLPEEDMEFLGYRIGQYYSVKRKRSFIGTSPSKKGVQSFCKEISKMTRRQRFHLEPEELVSQINRKLRGWANYFCLGSVSRSYRVVDNHTRHRLRQWLNGKRRSQGVYPVRQSAAYLHRKLGLLCLEGTTKRLPWAKA
ncbi:MAG: group II intron reverse transcriptase/maturase [Verrucomicrobiota bacterium]